MSWRHHVWGAMHETILKRSSEAQNVSELKVTLKKIWKNFPQVQLTNKAVASFRKFDKSMSRVTEDILRIFLYSKKCAHICCLHCLNDF